MNESFHIADLIVKKIKGIITSEELEELEGWIRENPENLSVYYKATDKNNHLDKLEVYSLFRKQKVWSYLENELFNTKTVKFIPQKFIRYAAAIFLPLLIAGVLSYIYLNTSAPATLADIDSVIKPGSQKAVLILSNGGAIELDEEKSLTDIHEGDARIKNENNLLSYSAEAANAKPRKNIFNELKTPRGGGYNLKLADGTGVWLNAGSSLKFPVSFTESTRQVFLEGEAYFEVSHNGIPFIVSSGDMDIRVLGTSFNVSAYSDETEFKTTLVEGKVRVEFGNNESATISRILTPNNQAILNRSVSEISIVEVNTSTYTSWMHGKMEFNNENLEMIMKRLARWYDFNYEFENIEAKEYHFSARLNNGDSISTILEMMEMTTNVKFEFRENRIVVLKRN